MNTQVQDAAQFVEMLQARVKLRMAAGTAGVLAARAKISESSIRNFAMGKENLNHAQLLTIQAIMNKDTVPDAVKTIDRPLSLSDLCRRMRRLIEADDIASTRSHQSLTFTLVSTLGELATAQVELADGKRAKVFHEKAADCLVALQAGIVVLANRFHVDLNAQMLSAIESLEVRVFNEPDPNQSRTQGEDGGVKRIDGDNTYYNGVTGDQISQERPAS